jgi:hypothetical protein
MALGRIGADADTAVPALIAALQDKTRTYATVTRDRQPSLY